MKEKRFQMLMEVELYEKLKELSKSKGISVAGYLRMLALEEIKRQEKE